jgi:hypothetical protein
MDRRKAAWRSKRRLEVDFQQQGLSRERFFGEVRTHRLLGRLDLHDDRMTELRSSGDLTCSQFLIS